MFRHILAIFCQPEVALPLCILGGSFFLKLFVGRDPSWSDAFKSLFELPVDAMFLGASFAAATVIGPTGNPTLGFICFGVSVPLIPFGTFLWRKSTALFDRAAYGGSAVVFLANVTFATIYVIVNIVIMIGGDK